VKLTRSLGIGTSRSGFLLALSIVIVMVFSLSAAAQNQYYVSTTGNDTNNGTSPATPWRTISHAVAAFSLGGSGAVINVHAGTYSGESLSCFGNTTAICISRGGSSPTVRLKIVCDTQWSVPSGSGCLIRSPNSNAMVGIQANNVDFGAPDRFGFDISNTNLAYGITSVCDATDHTPGHCSLANSAHILGNYIHDMSTSISQCEVNPRGHAAIIIPNRHGPYISDLQLIGNRISNIGPQALSKLNGGPGCFNYYGMYIMTQQSIIQNNVIINTAGYGIHAYSSPCQTVISNNTIIRTEKTNIIVGGGDCGNGVPSGNVTVSNNILGTSSNGEANLTIGVPGGSGVGSSGHGVLVSNNIFSGGAGGQIQIVPSNFTTVVNSKTEAPTTTFVNYTGGNNDDFHLKAGSVAIGAGATSCVAGGQSPCVAKFDIAGTIRINTPSLGAYEDSSSQASAPSAPTGLTAQVQ
jgi:hypothetical protein